jgi:hypothetical protein
MDARIRGGETGFFAWSRALIALVVLVAPMGCSPPMGTLDLIAQAQRSLTMARGALSATHAEQIKGIEGQSAELDAAFDADVRLVASGQITDANPGAPGPVKLTAEWVISARKGYAAAKKALTDKLVASQLTHATDLDNVQAGAEALDMARTLIVMQQNLSANIKGWLLSLQRRQQ